MSILLSVDKKETVEKPEQPKGFSLDPDCYYDWEHILSISLVANSGV